MSINTVYMFLLIAALTSCGTRDDYPVTVDGEIDVYFARFTEATNIPVVGISAGFTDLPGTDVGRCTVTEHRDWSTGVLISNTERVITADIEQWASASDLRREEIIYHEIGHCLLGRGHDDRTYLNSGVPTPVSVMHPLAFGDMPVYSEQHEYYLNELTGGNSK